MKVLIVTIATLCFAAPLVPPLMNQIAERVAAAAAAAPPPAPPEQPRRCMFVANNYKERYEWAPRDDGWCYGSDAKPAA